MDSRSKLLLEHRAVVKRLNAEVATLKAALAKAEGELGRSRELCEKLKQVAAEAITGLQDAAGL